VPAKGWKSTCYSYFAADIHLLTVEMSALMKGAVHDCLVRCMLNKLEPGVEVASIATLGQRWGLTDDAALGLMTEIVARIVAAQTT
jgi:hypothetical protein